VAHYRIGGKRTLFGKETLSFGGHSGRIIQAQKRARYKINEGDRLAELPLSCSQKGIMACNFVPRSAHHEHPVKGGVYFLHIVIPTLI